MVADDERWIRKGIIKMIEAEQLHISEIFEADSVEGAFEVFLKERPDIVIADVKFPREDGCTLCEKIYAVSPDTQIIMISGYREFEYVKRALSYKAIDYLLKPVDKTLLNETVRRCINSLDLLDKEKAEKEKAEKETAFSMQDGGEGYDGNEEGMQKIVGEVMEMIRKNYNKKLSLSEIAGSYHFSDAYFSYSFKKVAGISLMNYIMEVRVEKAKELMLSSNYNLKDIALRVGYPDQHYFTKIFKKMTGTSPKEYKMQIEKDIFEHE